MTTIHEGYRPREDNVGGRVRHRGTDKSRWWKEGCRAARGSPRVRRRPRPGPFSEVDPEKRACRPRVRLQTSTAPRKKGLGRAV